MALSHSAGKPLGTPTAGRLDAADDGFAPALLLEATELGAAELEDPELEDPELGDSELGAALLPDAVAVPVVVPAAAGFDAADEQAVAEIATRAPPARAMTRFSRFTPK